MKHTTIKAEQIQGIARLTGIKRWKIARAIAQIPPHAENVSAGWAWANTYTKWPERARAIMWYDPIRSCEMRAEVEDYEVA